MPSKEEMLVKLTHKGDGLSVEERVLFTLTGDSKLTQETAHAHRNSKATAYLFKAVFDSGILTEDQLDEILLDVAK
jgi:hypothetical protein